jgi:hypothetical protein
MLFQQLDKVDVFGQDDDVCTASRGKDLGIRFTLKVQIMNRQTIDGERRPHPTGERRWELRKLEQNGGYLENSQIYGICVSS